jgi:hypothetical protein
MQFSPSTAVPHHISPFAASCGHGEESKETKPEGAAEARREGRPRGGRTGARATSRSYILPPRQDELCRRLATPASLSPLCSPRWRRPTQGWIWSAHGGPSSVLLLRRRAAWTPSPELRQHHAPPSEARGIRRGRCPPPRFVILLCAHIVLGFWRGRRRRAGVGDPARGDDARRRGVQRAHARLHDLWEQDDPVES